MSWQVLCVDGDADSCVASFLPLQDKSVFIVQVSVVPGGRHDRVCIRVCKSRDDSCVLTGKGAGLANSRLRHCAGRLQTVVG
jgi:hypothetical protein